jgi:eukaryotic-like serine/threonine-protein kinase
VIGKTVHGYQVTAKIRDGSVGTVWKALNPEGETVALKQISLKNARLPHKLKEFEREAVLSRSLEHPQIIRVYDYVKASPQPFFVMEYFESESLKHVIACLPEWIYRKEFQILRKLGDALAYLHGREILHKDVKPENVLVSRDGEIRLIDFSLAKTKWDRRLQFGKKVEGTPLYMAPEQIRGEKCDARTDIYSFGALTYELLSRTAPFLAPTQDAIIRKQLEELPAPLMTHVASASPELNALIFQMLDKDPERRIPEMKFVLEHLARWELEDTSVRLNQVAPPTSKGRDARSR